MYNTIHGTNKHAPTLLAMLGIDQADGKWKSGRFRDAFLNASGAHILVYTRNGGGNRECWERTAGDGCLCPGCVITRHLPRHPNYLADHDDSFDATYATVEFSVPERFRGLAREMADGRDPETVGDKFKRVLEEMEGMEPEEVRTDPRFSRLARIVEDAVDGEGDGTIFI